MGDTEVSCIKLNWHWSELCLSQTQNHWCSLDSEYVMFAADAGSQGGRRECRILQWTYIYLNFTDKSWSVTNIFTNHFCTKWSDLDSCFKSFQKRFFFLPFRLVTNYSEHLISAPICTNLYTCYRMQEHNQLAIIPAKFWCSCIL